MSVYRPLFDLGQVAAIPSRSDWDLQFLLYKPDATSNAVAYSAVIASTDEVRFRLWRTHGDDALVVITDSEESDNDSSLTIDSRGVASATPAQVTVKLTAADLDLAVGSYQFLLDVMDDSDDDRWQPACRGTIRITSGPAAIVEA